MPIPGHSSEEIDLRSKDFLYALEQVAAAPSFHGLGVSYHPRIHIVLAQAYFALIDSYNRRVHLAFGTLTEQIKRAALTFSTVTTARPLIQTRMRNNDNENRPDINYILAMIAACFMIKRYITDSTFDAIEKIYVDFPTIEILSLDSLIEEAAKNDGALTSNWIVNLAHAELRNLNYLVSLFASIHLDRHPISVVIPKETPPKARLAWSVREIRSSHDGANAATPGS